jgi:signal transduction histidine kinase
MLWLLTLIGVIYLTLGLALYGFNLHERKEHPDDVEEEREELLIIYGLMAAVLPLAVFVAWRVTARLLSPLRSMLRAAQDIQQGGLDQRVEAPVATDELGQLAVTLNAAFDNYRRVLERIDRFSLDAAHQLRNPLASMRASAEVCLQRERTSAEYQEVLGGIIESARRLGHTVEQLLLLARLARDNLREVFVLIDLEALAGDLVENLRPAFEAANVRLEMRAPNGPFRIQGAPNLIEQAVANLLDNALRFTPEEGRVILSLQKSPPERIALSVSDTGPGVPHDFQVADAFNAAGTSPRAKDGTGLGLLVVSNVARAHGGNVKAKISESGGACFTIDLPAAT